jgi:hypothetical protein
VKILAQLVLLIAVIAALSEVSKYASSVSRKDIGSMKLQRNVLLVGKILLLKTHQSASIAMLRVRSARNVLRV